jgi:hypothetical protein
VVQAFYSSVLFVSLRVNSWFLIRYRMKKTPLAAISCAALMLGAFPCLAKPIQPDQPNYDEAKVPAYTLPDPLTCADGTRVKDTKTWERKRRPELLRLFEDQIYGHLPPQTHGQASFELKSIATKALGGKATRKEITVWLVGKTNGPGMSLLLYTPNGARQPVPAFLGMNFGGNHTISEDPGIHLSDRWVPDRFRGVVSNRATEASRGIIASRWPVETILSRGYALATVYYGDLEPDFPEGWKLGARAALSPAGTNTMFQPDQWGAIGAWAWGLSRAMDYLQSDQSIDGKRVALIGHSRLGKTALWGGALDDRFAIVIANESGEGGVALARRCFGERTANLNHNFPHWFCGNFKKYSGHENELPVDQHELIALIAPRPVYIGSAEEDRWSDPLGQFLAAKAAEPVYQLYGEAGLGVKSHSPINHPVGDFIGYHIRPGKHDVTAYDWGQYLNFADRHFK